MGFTVAELTAISTDENWKEGFIQKVRDSIYKVYNNSSSSPWLDLID
jgi:hypothetical protein